MADTVYNSTGGVNATTPTDPTKKKNLNLPYMQTGQNQVMPLASTAVNAGANAQGQPTGQLAPMQQLPQMNQQQMIQNTYQQASQQNQDPLQSLIGNTYAQQIQNYDQNANQSLQNTLENYDVQKAKAFEAARQAGAGAADSGIFQNDLLQTQLQNLRDRGNLEQQTKTANLENLNKVLSGAQTSATQQQTANDQFMKNLIAATQAGEGQANRQQTAEENELDRQHDIAMQKGDIEGAKEIERIKGEIQSGLQKESFAQESKENALDRTNALLLSNNDIQGNKDLTILKSKLDADQATTNYERQQAMDALARAHDIAIQNGDIAGKLAIEKLQGEITSQINRETQAWQTGERVASQAFTTTERLSTQDYDAGQKYLDRETQKSMQMQDYYNSLNLQSNEFNQQETMAKLTSDLEEARADNDFGRAQILEKLKGQIEAGLQDDAQASAKELAQMEQSNQRYLADQNANLQLKMQLQGFGHDEQLRYLDAQIAESKANGDTERSRQLMSYQTQLNLQELGAKAGYEEKKAYLDNELAKALQDNDAEHAEVLQKARLDQEAQQFSEEIIIKRAVQALEEKKVNIAQVENDYNKVVEMFGEDSEAAHEFLINTLNANGIDTSGNEYAFVDATEQAKKALQAEYDLQKEQFIMSHPEMMGDSVMTTDNIKALKDFAINEYNAKRGYDDANSPISKFVIAVQSGKKDFTLDELENYGLSEKQISSLFTTKTQGTNLSNNGLKAMNDYINSAIYGEETAAQKEAKANAGYLDASDIPMAEAGQKFNITEDTTVRNASGSKVSLSPGKYYADSETRTVGNNFIGKTTHTTLFLYNENGDRVMSLKRTSNEGAAGWKTMADPVLGIFGGV